MSRPRAYDWDEAKRLRAEGWTLTRIAEHFGVSATSVSYAVNDEARAVYYRNMHDRRYWLRGTCVDCGTAIGTKRVRCVGCHVRNITTTVRDDQLRCANCKQWLPDEHFPAGKALSSQRRGRHPYCRPCQTKVKRAWRKRNPEKARETDRNANGIERAESAPEIEPVSEARSYTPQRDPVRGDGHAEPPVAIPGAGEEGSAEQGPERAGHGATAHGPADPATPRLDVSQPLRCRAWSRYYPFTQCKGTPDKSGLCHRHRAVLARGGRVALSEAEARVAAR